MKKSERRAAAGASETVRYDAGVGADSEAGEDEPGPAARTARDTRGRPRLGAADSGASPSTIVEVQFRAGATGLAKALASDTQGFLAATSEAGSSPGGAALQGVLRRYNPESGWYSFDDAYVEEDVKRLEANAASSDAAARDPLARLPPLQSFVRLQFPAPEAAAAAARDLRLHPDVEKAVVVPGASPPNGASLPTDTFIGTAEQGIRKDPDDEYEPQWYLHRTRVPEAWALGARGAGVVIADIDWGFRITHQDLASRVEPERAFNAFNRNKIVTEGSEVFHGTGVLGLAGAAADGLGMAGYAPGASLWPIQGDSGTGLASAGAWHNAIEHVRRARTEQRKVIILEVQTDPAKGNYEQMGSVNLAIRRAIASGVVVCVSAGNGNRRADLEDDGVTPIDPTGSILVGATAWDKAVNRREPDSNWGPRIVVSAPGDVLHDVTCWADPDDATLIDLYSDGFGGTSGAAAKVAGVAALMLSVNPSLSHDQVREILRGTGTRIEPEPDAPEKQIGVFLDAAAAVTEALRRPGAVAAGPQPVPGRARIQGLSRHAPSVRSGPPSAGLQPPGGGEPDRTLREFRSSTEGLMTREEQRLAVDQAIQLLDLYYVHRPLKESMHAVRPVQRLRVLRCALDDAPDAWTGRQEMRFHNAMTEVFTSVRDLHTNYLLPQPYRDYTAYLPFLVRPCRYEDGSTRYLVTRVVPGYKFASASFGPEAEILSWNGVEIHAAVELYAQQTPGSNPAARYARGVDALTLRPMNVSLPPEADWVHLTFRRDGGPVEEMRQDWLVRFTPPEPAGNPGGWSETEGVTGEGSGETPAHAGRSGRKRARTRSSGTGRSIQEETSFRLSVPADPTADEAGVDRALLVYRASEGVDVGTDAVREVKQLLFTPERVSLADERARNGIPDDLSPDGDEVPTHMPLVFEARRLKLSRRERAYVRIRTFRVDDPDEFVQEFVRLVEALPQDGMILDVRGNGGGHILAAERLLQTLVPGRIEPERMQFISTAGTLELCRRNQGPPLDLTTWTASLAQAVMTGATYSQALPITDPDSCNDLGQRYHGPVVLLVDARCYSATDIFAAGFEDHGIGTIIGTSAATGAGGANVWDHDFLYQRNRGDGSPLQALPHGMGMRIAIRQSLRVGPRAGTLLENFGVAPKPDHVHPTTRRDLRENDAELLEFAAGVLAKLPAYRLALEETGRSGEQLEFRVLTGEIDRLDFYLNHHPAASVRITPGAPYSFTIDPGTHVELRGFSTDETSGTERWVATLKRVLT